MSAMAGVPFSHLPNTPANYFWTPVAGSSASVWVVNFSNGETGTDFTVRTFVVRCVR